MRNESLATLHVFITTHLSWFREFIMMNKSSLDAAFDKIDNQLSKKTFDNLQSAKLDGGRFILGEATKDFPTNKKSLVQVEKQSADKQESRELEELRKLGEAEELGELEKLGESELDSCLTPKNNYNSEFCILFYFKARDYVQSAKMRLLRVTHGWAGVC